MNMKNLPKITVVSMAIAGVMVVSLDSQARVTGFDISDTADAYAGERFGDAGAYQRVNAVASFAIDPASPRAKDIVDVDKAQVNDQGDVVFSTDVVILRPTEQASGLLFYEVPNRGRNLSFPLLNLSSTSGDFTVEDPGDGFLMRQGHTMVWSGWQTGLSDSLLGIDLPVIEGVTGESREEFIFDNHESVSVVSLTYPSADQNPEHASLTVRPTPDAPRQIVEGLSFRYVDENHVEIQRPSSMDGGAIYEFIYPAAQAVPAGLGMLATSDLISFLRGAQGHDVETPLNNIEHTVAMGISQSGRFLRDLIYQGYNADSQGNRVFDGAMAHIAGSRKTFTNYPFAQPGRYSRQHEDHDAAGDQFPFSYVDTFDPLTDKRDSVLAACRENNTCPKLMHTDTSTEFWQARASLVATSPTGDSLTMPDDVRLYFFAGAPHFNAWGASSSDSDVCQYPTNPLSVAPSMRALVSAMTSWVTNDVAPPANRYPGLQGEGLVDNEALSFPPLQGEVPQPPINALYVRNHHMMPSEAGEQYPVKVPDVDADGIALGGIRQPYVAVPLGTYLGWNLRDQGYAKGQLCGTTGSFIAFASRDDGRKSVSSRYPTPDAYQASLEHAIDELVDTGFMLEQDRQWVMEGAPAL
ncbi:MAG: alpha/beta hydrolase domain-containing protein [Halomonas sp.]|uniref:alpha/beta hydrolase domain-containing protein n=1 Tax=Halomonas sp. TaxID=1486246 RepID=UPI003F92815C